AARTPRGAATSAPASTEVRTSSAPPRPEHPARAERPEGRGKKPGPAARQRLSSALLRFVPTVPASHTGRTHLDPWPNWSCAHFEWIAGGAHCNGRATGDGPFLLGFSRLRREVSTEIARHPVPLRQFFAERAAVDADAEVRAITLRDAISLSLQPLPYTGIAVPWIRRASSLHRKRMTRAISWGLGHFAKLALGIAFRFASVSMMFGRIVLARTPVPRRSSARESIIATAAAFDAE